MSKAMTWIAAGILVARLSGPAQGDVKTWTSAQNGDFSDGGKWTGGAPGFTDEAHFTAAGTYQVTWTGSAMNRRAVVSWTTTGQTLTHQIGSYTWTLTNGYDVGINGTDRCRVLQSSGSLAVSNGAGTANFIIGNRGQTQYTLTNGTISTDRLYVGYNFDGDNNTLTIKGPNAHVGLRGASRVGNAGGADGNALVITNAGRLVQTGGELRAGTDGVHNRIIVTGAGSRLERTSTTAMYMGMAGSGGRSNLFAIVKGGYVTNAAALHIGYESVVNDHNEMRVDGADSAYIGASLTLGRYGDFNRIIVTNGGRFSCFATGSTDVQIGGDQGGGGNYLMVTGTNTSFRSRHLVLGRSYAATGPARMNVSNRVEVADGGTLAVAANLTIATGNYSSNCLMTIRGAGSTVTVGDSLTLCENVKGRNLLTLSDAATLCVATNLYVGRYSNATTGNTLRVSNGHLYVTNAVSSAKLDLLRGNLRVEKSAGTIVVDAMDMTAGSAACTLAFVADSAGVTPIKVNGALTVNNSNRLSVDVSDYSLSGSLVLIDYGTMTTPFSEANITLTGKRETYVYAFDQFTNTALTLHIRPRSTVIVVQ